MLFIDACSDCNGDTLTLLPAGDSPLSFRVTMRKKLERKAKQPATSGTAVESFSHGNAWRGDACRAFFCVLRLFRGWGRL